MPPSTADHSPKPTRTLKIPFTPPRSDRKCETAVFVYGDLSKTNHVPLICVHGGPGAASLLFVPFAQLWEEHGIPVILYDQLSCGDSTHLRDTGGDTKFWSMDLFVAELNNVIDHFKLEKYDVLGNSWGGMIVLDFALTQPKGLRKLVLYSTCASVALREEAARRQRDELPEELRDAMIKGEDDESARQSGMYRAAFTEFTKRHLCRIDPWPPLMMDTIKVLDDDETVTATLWGGMNTKHTGPMKDWDVTGRLGEITEETVPGGALLINGKYDWTPDNCMEPLEKDMRCRRKWVRFERSSHVAHLEEPEKFYEVMGSFLLEQ